MKAWSELRGFGSYLAALRRYLQQPLTQEEAVTRIRRQLERREDAFLEILGPGVFQNPRSPYLALFREAGVEQADVARLVRDEGLEPALERLYDVGVRVTLEESRGHSPIRRGGTEFPTRATDFANPLAASHFEVRTGGSRSGGTPVGWNFALIDYAAGYNMLLLTAHGLQSAPTATWRPAPPGAAGLSAVLTHAKLEEPVRRWFSQTEPGWRGASAKHALLTRATVVVSRLAGRPLPMPEYTPPERADEVARWLAETKASGRLPSLVTTPGSAVRVCLAAREHGLDISGTVFRLGGEPYTDGRAAEVAAAGCGAIAGYYMAEFGGHVGMPCAAPEALDDVHLLTDKVAVILREKQVGPSAIVGALTYTTLHPSCPKLLINLESDDYASVRERDCGCLFGDAGFSLHLHDIRSYEKLTSEGTTFLGSDVIRLLEQVLPGRFGGSATDYQLVEQEQQGVSRVAIVISPRVGDVDESRIVEAVISFLRSRGPAQAMMADVWNGSGTLHVVRREPYVTGGKIQAVHVLGGRSTSDQSG